MSGWKDDVRRIAGAAGKAMETVAQQVSRPSHICTHCGYAGQPYSQSRMNGCFAIVLLCLFIVPGVLYILYTMRGQRACPQCRAVGTMIPINTPHGRELLDRQQVGGAPAPSVARSVPSGDRRYCAQCGTPNPGNARFCVACGQLMA